MSRHVLWIHQNFVSDRQCGNSRPVHIVSAMLERGMTVEVVTTSAGYLAGDGGDCGDPVQREGGLTLRRLPIGGVPGGPHSRSSWYRAFLRQVARHSGRFERPDLLFASSPPLPQVWPALRWPGVSGCPSCWRCGISGPRS